MTPWVTFDNNKVNLEEIDHQHLSNIYYFINILFPVHYDESTKLLVGNILHKRFNDHILPYRPNIRFRNEIQYLMGQGFLKFDGTIVINGNCIGHL